MNKDAWIDFVLTIILDLRDAESTLEREFATSDDYAFTWTEHLETLSRFANNTVDVLRQRLDILRQQS